MSRRTVSVVISILAIQFAPPREDHQISRFVKDVKKSNVKALNNLLAKVETLNQQFFSVFTQEDVTNIPTLGPNSGIPSIASLVINLKGVEQHLHSLIEDKAPGPDQHYPWLLKMAAAEIAPILTDIFQTSIREEKSPKRWREANIWCIFKKRDRSNPKFYRPISLTCDPFKILEHIILSHIMKHLVDYGILVDSQHSPRGRRSTETQLLATVHDIAYALQCNNSVFLAILDFTKAFDSVRLLSKLEYYRSRGPLHSWLLSFLTRRMQTVVCDGASSSLRKVTFNVPQGTVLAPPLFFPCINDFPSKLQCTVRLFADHRLLYAIFVNPTSDAQLLQNDLYKIEEWQITLKMFHFVHHPEEKSATDEFYIFWTSTREFDLPSLLGCSVR